MGKKVAQELGGVPHCSSSQRGPAAQAWSRDRVCVGCWLRNKFWELEGLAQPLRALTALPEFRPQHRRNSPHPDLTPVPGDPVLRLPQALHTCAQTYMQTK